MMEQINQDAIEAIVNEYRDIQEMLTENVRVERMKAPQGSDCLWKFTVNAPTYIITGVNDTKPVAVDQIVFYLDVKHGFPKVKPYVYYEPGKILASVNAYATSGAQCIDDWHYDEMNAGNNSTLAGTVRKTIMDIIHIPEVSRYDSMANSSLREWQQDLTQRRILPTCPMGHVLRGENGNGKRNAGTPSLPVRANQNSRKVTPPALPTRR